MPQAVGEFSRPRRMMPPVGIASRALIARFRIASSSWLLSTHADARSGSLEISRSIVGPRVRCNNSLIIRYQNFQIDGPWFQALLPGHRQLQIADHSREEIGETQFPCLTTVRLGYWPHASCQNFSCPERGGTTHHVWYSLEGGPYSGTRIRGNCYRFPRFRHGESA